MGHEENYYIWSGSSIGGCLLEEASEQERIPSIIESSLSKVGPEGFSILKVSTIIHPRSNEWLLNFN
jgi:hypothetical protein